MPLLHYLNTLYREKTVHFSVFHDGRKNAWKKSESKQQSLLVQLSHLLSRILHEKKERQRKWESEKLGWDGMETRRRGFSLSQRRFPLLLRLNSKLRLKWKQGEQAAQLKYRRTSSTASILLFPFPRTSSFLHSFSFSYSLSLFS